MLIITGSPREKNTSYQFAKTFASSLVDETCEIVWGYKFTNKIDDLYDLIGKHETIGFFMPLYVDSVPGPIVKLLEKLSERSELLSAKALFSVGQCGFPDNVRMDPMHGVMECFAESMNMKWLGSLSYGGGAVIDGAPIESLGGRGEAIKAGLSLAAASVSIGEMIPDAAEDTMALNFPKFVNRLLCLYLNYSAKKNAKEHGVDMKRKYYLE